MATEEVQLAWRFTQTGADEVKAKIQALNQQFNAGEITSEQYTRALNQQARVATTLGNQEKLNERIYLAQHPAINQLTRTMSGFNRVLSATSTAMTAINTAQLLMRTDQGNMTELENQLAKAERDYNTALDPETKEKAAEQIAKIKDEMQKANEQVQQDKINGWVSFASSIGSVATSIGVLLPKIIPMAGILAPIGFIVGGIAAAFYMWTTPAKDITDTLTKWTSIDFSGFTKDLQGLFDFLSGKAFLDAKDATENFWDVMISPIPTVREALTNFFMKTIPDAFSAFEKWIENGANYIVKIIENMAGGIIKAIQNALAWLAKLPSDIGNGIGSFVSNPLGAIGGALGIKKGASGLETTTNGPTLFMAGEGGTQERVRIEPVGTGGGGSSSSGGQIVNNIYVQGSIHAEKDLENVIDRYGIRQARLRGWR